MEYKLTNTAFCPHCKEETETIRLEPKSGGKCTIYKCMRCLKEPSGEVTPMTHDDLIKLLGKMIDHLKG